MASTSSSGPTGPGGSSSSSTSTTRTRASSTRCHCALASTATSRGPSLLPLPPEVMTMSNTKHDLDSPRGELRSETAEYDETMGWLDGLEPEATAADNTEDLARVGETALTPCARRTEARGCDPRRPRARSELDGDRPAPRRQPASRPSALRRARWELTVPPDRRPSMSDPGG